MARSEHTDTYMDGKQDNRKPFVFFIGKRKNLNNRFESEVLDNHLVARYTEVKTTI
jgi:hypothetical protein